MHTDKPEKRVWFPRWAEALAREPWPESQREAYRRVISGGRPSNGGPTSGRHPGNRLEPG